MFELSDRNPINSVDSYLNQQKQRRWVNSYYSACKKIIDRFSQGSFLGSPAFDIYICDLFLFTQDYIFENTPKAGLFRTL